MKSRAFKNYFSLSIKLILILSIINALLNEFWHLMSANIFLLILMFVPKIVKKYEIKIPAEFEWTLLIFVVFTFFLGRIKGIVAPISFGIATSLIGFMILAILYSSNQIKKNYFLIILFSFNFTIAFGFAIELMKYYIKIILGQEVNAGVYIFSMQTMSFVILGAIASSIFGILYMEGYGGFFRKVIYKIIKSNPKIFKKENSEKEILELIENGESENLEFKETLRYNLYTNEIDKKIEYSTLKTISAFLNNNGGILIIGIKDNKEISGIEKDKFENTDKFLLHLTNILKQKIGKRSLHLIKTNHLKIQNKTILLVEIKKSSHPIFLKNFQNQEEFYIRTGNATTQINGSELLDYIKKRFDKI